MAFASHTSDRTGQSLHVLLLPCFILLLTVCLHPLLLHRQHTPAEQDRAILACAPVSLLHIATHRVPPPTSCTTILPLIISILITATHCVPPSTS
eukprot:976959-Pelagomonas_calceolata.AAC.4